MSDRSAPRVSATRTSAATKSVFISYARRASAPHAKALHQALGADSFLDESDVEIGERFSEVVIDALLGSRVVVIFADEAYFQRWYCLWELRTALGPAAFAGESAAGLHSHSVEHVVIVLPADDKRPAEIDHLPVALASANWPRAPETARIAELVQARLVAVSKSVGQLYAEAGERAEFVKGQLLQMAETPPPRSLAGLRTYPAVLPPPLKTFVGRSHDLWRLDFALSTLRAGAPGTRQAVSIEGGGGFGKSTLAREYAYRLGAARFPGGIFWINAEEPLDAQFHGVLQLLKNDIPDLPDFQREHRDARTELEKAVATEAAKAPILWVADNIPESGNPLREYCPGLGKVAVLTTSRFKLSVLETSVLSLPLGVLDRQSAIDLLIAELSPTPSLRDCEIVAEWVGRLPVALVVLNASLRLRRLTLSELVAATRGHGGPARPLDEELKALAANKRSRGLPSGFAQAFGLSYDRLSPGAQEGARLIAHLAPSAIPFELANHLGLSADVRGELVETSFVGDIDSEARNMQSVFPAFGTMHPVMADYVRSRAADATSDVIRAIRAIIATLNEALRAHDQWRVLLHCAPHAQHLFELTDPNADRARIPLEVRAALAATLSNTSGELGRREEALAEIQEAVEAFRSLAKAKPHVFEPEFAGSLVNLCARMREMGRREEALAAIRDAVEAYRRLAKTTPDAFEPDLGMSLNSLSACLSELGRRAEALAAIEDAVEIRRRLAKARPDVFEPDLAMSLNNLSAYLGELGRWEEALAAIEAAVEIYTRLAEAKPDAFEPDLAMSLNNLSGCLTEFGRREEALAAIEHAVEIRRRLTKARPDAFEPELARSLSNLSNRLGELGRWEEALVAIENTVAVYRRLAKATPDAFEPDFAMSLNDLSGCLSELGRAEEALTAIEDAVGVYRRLAKAMPDAFEPDLAMSLNNLSVCLSELGHRDDALAAIEDAVEVYRQLAAATPDAFEPDLAMSLNNVSACLSELGRHDEALPTIEHAVGVYRRLADKRPDALTSDLAMSLNNLSACLNAMGRHQKALPPIEEAVDLYRRLAKARPDAIEPYLAMSLNNLSSCVRDLGRHEEALAAIEQAVDIYRRLAKARPEAREPYLAMTLDSLAACLSKLRREREMRAAERESEALRTRRASNRALS